jgi:hypothetical protein
MIHDADFDLGVDFGASAQGGFGDRHEYQT